MLVDQLIDARAPGSGATGVEVREAVDEGLAKLGRTIRLEDLLPRRVLPFAEPATTGADGAVAAQAPVQRRELLRATWGLAEGAEPPPGADE